MKISWLWGKPQLENLCFDRATMDTIYQYTYGSDKSHKIFPAKFVTFEPVHTGPEWRLFVQKLFLLQKDINYTWIGLIIIKIGEKIVNSDFRGCMTIFQKIHFHNFSTSNFEYWKKCSYLDTFQSFLDLLMIFQILSRHSYSWETWKNPSCQMISKLLKMKIIY